MKKTLIILFTLAASTAFSQVAVNAHASVSVGYNQAAPVAYTPAPAPATYSTGTMTYSGGVTPAVVHYPAQQRMRYEIHPNGKCRWRIVEHSRFVPGYWFVDQYGCRRWADGYTEWYTVSRNKDCYAHCSHGHGHGGHHGKHKGHHK